MPWLSTSCVLRREPAGVGLGRLLRLVGDGRLRPSVELTAPWTELPAVAPRVLSRGLTGKAVLTIGDSA